MGLHKKNPFFHLIFAGVAAYIFYKLITPKPVVIEPEIIQPKPAPPAPVVKREYPPRVSYNPSKNTAYGSARWEDPNLIREKYASGYSPDLSHFDKGGFYIGANCKVEQPMHAVTVAGSGQGKGVCLILPSLLCKPNNSWFVLDPKGENALITARFQQEAGQKVILLDPWNEQKRLGATHGIEPAGFNPLAFIKGNSDEMPESCGVIAEMLVPFNPRLADSFWESRARSLIRTYLLHLITARPDDEQHLGTLYRWLRLPVSEREILWEEMYQNRECDDLVRSGIGEFIGLSDDSGPLPSIITTAQDNTGFLESKALRASLASNEFDPYDLTDGQTTVYLCLPERFLDSHSRWLRLVVGVCLKACNYRPNKRVNFLLDEFAILGKMTAVERAFAFSRGQNISVWIFVQSLTQLNDIYGENGASAFLSNARLRQFFGVYDLQTQRYLSEYLGETTIQSRTYSHTSSSGSTTGWASGSPDSTNTGGSSSTNIQSMGRRLLTAEEVGKNKSIITLLDSHKFLLGRMPFWADIYSSYEEGDHITFNARDRDDWEAFVDEFHGLRERRQVFSDHFISRADGHKVKLDSGQKGVFS